MDPLRRLVRDACGNDLSLKRPEDDDAELDWCSTGVNNYPSTITTTR